MRNRAPRAAGSGDVKVGLITKTDTNPFFVKMKEGAEKSAKAEGVELMTAAGKFDGDNAGQVTAIENMVAAGMKGILITPSDSKAIVPALEKAKAQGVLVIALDTPTEPESAVDALFATDNLKAGELIGELLTLADGSAALVWWRTGRPRALRLGRGVQGDDQDALGAGLLERGHDGLGIARGDQDALDPGGDHVLDGGDLPGVVAVELACRGGQLGAVLLGGLLRALLHLHEERVGVGLGDQTDLDVARTGCSRCPIPIRIHRRSG